MDDSHFRWRAIAVWQRDSDRQISASVSRLLLAAIFQTPSGLFPRHPNRNGSAITLK
jgi:hypothetical protein